MVLDCESIFENKTNLVGLIAKFDPSEIDDNFTTGNNPFRREHSCVFTSDKKTHQYPREFSFGFFQFYLPSFIPGAINSIDDVCHYSGIIPVFRKDVDVGWICSDLRDIEIILTALQYERPVKQTEPSFRSAMFS